MLLNSFFHIVRKEVAENGLDVVVRLHPEHEIYKAHFPDQPITPGVCQIQIVTDILSFHMGCKTYLTDIKTVKFMSVISPCEVTELTVRFLKMVNDGDTCKVSVMFVKEEQVFSKMSMTYHVVRDNSNI